MTARKKSQAKLELILLGVFVCVLSTYSLTQTRIFLLIEQALDQMLRLLPDINISASIVLHAVVAASVLLVAISAILSDHPSGSRGLFYLALLLFVPSAVSSGCDWISVSVTAEPFSEISTTQALLIGSILSSGLLFQSWYSEYADLVDDLSDKGAEALSEVTAPSLLLGIGSIALSGLLGFAIGLVAFDIGDLALSFRMQFWQVLLMLGAATGLVYAALWYLASIGRRKEGDRVRRAPTSKVKRGPR